MWPAWGYGLWAPLPGVCVRRALPLLGPVARAVFTNEPITRWLGPPAGVVGTRPGTVGVF